MLKFSTTTPVFPNSNPEIMKNVKPLITPDGNCQLIDGEIKGKEAFIVGDALQLAGFNLPCFFDGEITELDNPDGEIVMVLPSGEYPIIVMFQDDNYYLDLKAEKRD